MDEKAVETFTPKGATTSSGGLTGPPSSGDQLVLNSTLVRNGTAFGTDRVTFLFEAGGKAQINAIENFPNGTVLARGTAAFDQTLTLPIVSGTGAYSGVTGTLLVNSVSGTLNHLTFTLKR